MANAGPLKVAINLTGDLSAIVRALDLMGVALADHGHVWTAEERAAYEEAIRILDDKSRRVVEPVAKPGSRCPTCGGMGRVPYP